MAYTVNGSELETDDQGYLREPDYSDEVVRVIAAAESIELTDAHWQVVNYLRDEYREHGHTPNFRNLLKGMAERRPGTANHASAPAGAVSGGPLSFSSSRPSAVQ